DREAAGGPAGARDRGEPGHGRLGRRVHLADDDLRLGHDLLDLHVPGAVQRQGDRDAEHRREDPRDPEPQLLTHHPLPHPPPLGRRRRTSASPSGTSEGAATVLFLADVPDQVQVLTLYGKLQMGFKNAAGAPVAFVVPDPPPAIPTASLSSPPSGGSFSVGEL